MSDRLIFLTESEFREALTEGQKSIATHRGKGIADILGSSKVITKRKYKLKETKQLKILKRKYQFALEDVLEDVENGDLNEKAALSRLRDVFNETFRQAYALGLKAQGVGSRRKTGRIVSLFTENDNHFIRTAVGEELRYMSKFVKAIYKDSTSMTIENRMRLYVNGLDGLFGAGRVAALPANSVIWWAGPVDKNKCESCFYMRDNSPYMPHTLPTTPRAGDTLCLGNCRDKLVVRLAESAEIRRVEEGKTRAEHISSLNKIRANRRRKQARRRK